MSNDKPYSKFRIVTYRLAWLFNLLAYGFAIITGFNMNQKIEEIGTDIGFYLLGAAVITGILARRWPPFAGVLLGCILLVFGAPDPTCGILLATMVTSVILVVWHPVKLLAMIQAILTGLAVVGFMGVVTVAGRLVKAHEPVQQSWEPVISGVALWITSALWILFTIFHAVVVWGRKLHTKADVSKS